MFNKSNRTIKSQKQKQNNLKKIITKKKKKKINKNLMIKKMKILKILKMKKNYMILMVDIYQMIHFMNIEIQKEEDFLLIIQQEK